MKLIVHQGFGYQWNANAFLSEPQVAYALQQLWRLVAGSSNWDGSPAIKFDAIESREIERMLDAPPNSMSWIPLANVSPQGWASPLDTDCLPSLCCALNAPSIYDGKTSFPLDLVAATFIQLTRWEEWVRPDLDEFGCHKEDSSIAMRQGFRDRPVIDEWALVLRAWLKKARPGWKEAIAPYSVDFSHDIDILRYYKNPFWVARSFARKLFKEHRGLASFEALYEGVSALLDPGSDPCATAFDTLMNFSESRGARSTFFFMAANHGKFDDGYALNSPLFKSLHDRIRSRGHRFGWHPGFLAAEDDSVFDVELTRLSQAIKATCFGARHHFLRWRAGYSWKRLELKGIPFDASMGYNQNLGFRASTARSYGAYDLTADLPLALEVQPLIAMDGPLIRDAAPIAENIALLARRCAAVDGCLTILVHNYSLMYEPTLLAAIADGLVAGEAR